MTTPRRARVAACVGLLSLAGAESARAQDHDDHKAAAQALFESARSLLEQGHFAEACPKFAESHRLAPGIGTMLWLADCYESSGRVATAWAAFKEAAAAAAQRGDAREQVARDRASKLESRLSRLDIVGPSSSPPKLEVRRDGVVVGSAEWGTPVPLDPGIHSVSATAPGCLPWSATVTVKDDDEAIAMTIPVLQCDSPSEPPQTAAVEPAAISGAAQRTLGLAVGGGGALALAIGVVASVAAKSKYDESNAGPCNGADQCNATGKDERRSALSAATVATVAMSVGAAALLGGGLIYFTAPSAKSASLALVPGGGGGMLRVGWAF